MEKIDEVILVTGCNGFIGKGFIEEFSYKYKIIGVDKIKSSSKVRDYKEYNFDISNLEKLEEVLLSDKVTCIIHTAAEKSLINCEKNKEEAYKINYETTIKLAELSEKYKIKFIFISSDQVFDGKQGNYKENDKVSAINYYGKLKIMAEEKLKNISKCAICRTALVIGNIPEEQKIYFDSIKMQSELVVQGFIVQQVKYCLKNNIKINLPINEFVSPTHVRLLAKQLDVIIEKDISGILHCSGNDCISRYEMGKMIATKYNLSDTCINGAEGTNPLRPKNVSLNCEYTEKKLEIKFLSFNEMLMEYDYD